MVRAAAELFHKKGISATKLREIVQLAGGDKRLFYRYFKNKQGIVHEVLQCYFKAIETGRAPIKYEIESWQDLRDWFAVQIQLQRSFGMNRRCPFGTIAEGLTENDELIRHDIERLFDLMADKLKMFFSREQNAGRISQQVNAREVAYFCIACAQGATLLGKMTRNSQTVESALRVAIACIEDAAQRHGGAVPHNGPLSRAARGTKMTERGMNHQPTRVGARIHDARLRMIQVAGDLFHKQGVFATSRDQIIELSGTGKGQFYHYFKSKEGIVHDVLQRYLSVIGSKESAIEYEISSWHDVGRWFARHIDLQKRFGMTRGCPLGTIGNELTESDALIRQDLNLIVEAIHNKLAAFFLSEKAKGLLPKEVDEDGMADFCIAAIQGAMLLGKVKRNARVVEAVAKQAFAYIERKTLPRRASASAGSKPPETAQPQ